MCSGTQNVQELFVRKVVKQEGGVPSWTLIMLDKKIFVTLDIGLIPWDNKNYIFSATVDTTLNHFFYSLHRALAQGHD